MASLVLGLPFEASGADVLPRQSGSRGTAGQLQSLPAQAWLSRPRCVPCGHLSASC